MSYKFDSLIMILKKLDRKEHITVHSLMDDLEISERTAYRYLQTLQVAGFPVSYNREKESYAFDDGFELGKPDLTLEESLALALSRRFLNNFGTGMEESLRSIEGKLSARHIELPRHIILQAASLPSNVQGYLGTIHQAIRNYKRIEITYNALYTGEETVRKVDSYYLFFQDDFWHLRGYCHLRDGYRTFALDKISSLRILSEYFIPQPISPEDELSGSFGEVIDGEPVEVILVFDQHIAPYIQRKKWHESQKEENLRDGNLQVTFTLNGYKGIKQWIYRWLPYVTVQAPMYLKKELTSELRVALKRI